MALNFLKENVFLANLTTLGVGGKAKYFTEAKTQEELKSVVFCAEEKGLPFFILGGGSNLLVSDEGFEGVVIKTRNQNIKIFKNLIEVEAGFQLPRLAMLAANYGLGGLEFYIGIPGTVGGAVYGNAGAFGTETKDVLSQVKIFYQGKEKILAADNLQYAYRDSLLKRMPGAVILEAQFLLKKDNKEKIKKRTFAFLKKKRSSQPMDNNSCGCIFKNPEFPRNQVSNAARKKLLAFDEINKFKKAGRLPAAWLIDKCGLKGKKVGRAIVSDKHANFILNLGGATCKDIVRLTKDIKERVEEVFNINLEEEIIYFGCR